MHAVLGHVLITEGSKKVETIELELEVGLESKDQHSGGFGRWIILTIF